MESRLTTTGRWLALSAAILGWMFDGLEMGLFPLAARPALKEVLFSEADNAALEDMSESDKEVEVKRREGIVGGWIGIITAGFLVGAATGGVLFGWLGDRLGRVRAMALSVLTYAIFSGLCGFVGSAHMLFLWRFLASLGMGGEWALGVSLVMELWPGQSRGWLAGLIGAAANVGFVLIAVVSISLNEFVDSFEVGLLAIGVSKPWTLMLTQNQGWRLLMMFGALPALLTFFIRVFVPESEKWLEEHKKGTTSHWATVDLLGVLFGSMGPLGMIWLWSPSDDPTQDVFWTTRILGSIPLLGIAIAGYLYPVQRYLARAQKSLAPDDSSLKAVGGRPIIRTMLLGATLSGIALMGTWGSLQWAASWADQLADEEYNTFVENLPEEHVSESVLQEVERLTPEKRHAKEWTQIVVGIGAILGTILAAVIGHKVGRRITYAAMCLLSLVSVLIFYRLNSSFGTMFLVTAFFAGGLTATFYGWLPLYLPELFPTKVRATGQGFSFNFGRILAAAASLQTGALMAYFNGNYPNACSVMVMVYLVGVLVIWLAPETRGTELIE